MKKVLSFIFILVLILCLSISSVSVFAADFGCEIATSSSAIYMENLDTNTVVHEKNADEKMYPASLTKIMSYIIVVENIEDLENTKITIKEDAFVGLDPESSVMGLQSHLGEEFSVKDLLYGMMVPSGNDAAWVLADYIGEGSVQNFVDMMNKKAKELKCNDTHFVNPHGLYDDDHYSTANDLAVITKYAVDKPYFMEITGTFQYNVSGMSEPIESTNYMLDPSRTSYYYPYIESGKTGYTDEAGKCLVTTAKKDDYRYLCIALGAPFSYEDEINYAMLDSKSMYAWAFDNISFVELLPAEDVIESLDIKYVWGNKQVDAVAKNGVKALLPNDYDKTLVSSKADLPSYVEAPVKKGDVLGSITVYYDGESVGTTDIVCAEDVDRSGFIYFLHQIKDFIANNFILVAVVVVVLIIILLMISSARKRKRRRNARHRYR